MLYHEGIFNTIEDLIARGFSISEIRSKWLPVFLPENTLLTIRTPNFMSYSMEFGAVRVDFTERNKNITELQRTLCEVRVKKLGKLDAAFIRIETKQPRNARGLILSFVDGSFPTAAYAADMLTNIPDAEAPTLTPDQEQRIIDVGIMYEIEELVEYNRGLLRELNALTITDDMTLEEAQAVVLKAVSIKPWVPWEE